MRPWLYFCKKKMKRFKTETAASLGSRLQSQRMGCLPFLFSLLVTAPQLLPSETMTLLLPGAALCCQKGVWRPGTQHSLPETWRNSWLTLWLEFCQLATGGGEATDGAT